MSISPAQWQADGAVERIGDYELFAIEAGDPKAPKLLLIHGFPTSSWDWAPVWAGLTERFHCLAIDMLGFGWSSKPQSHTYSILEQADLITALARRRGFGRCHALAHDYGDTVAQELLARSNQGTSNMLALQSLCLLNGGLFPETHRARVVQQLLNSPIGWLVAKAINYKRFANAMRAICSPGSLDDAELRALWDIILVNDGHRLGHRLIRYIDERKAHRERWVGAMQNTQTPIRVINGALDPVSGAHMVERYRELIADPDVVSLPDAGHYPQLEQPSAVLDAYLDFHDSRLSTNANHD